MMSEIQVFMSQFHEVIELIKKQQKPKYSIKQNSLVTHFNSSTKKLDEIIEQIESSLFQKINPEMIYLACILVERLGITLIIRNSFQKLMKSLFTLLTSNTQRYYSGDADEGTKNIIYFYALSLQILCFVSQKKFFPIHADRGTLELENIHEINKYLDKYYVLDPINIQIEQSDLDGLVVQMNLILKENTRKYIQIKRKEKRDKQMNKLGSIIESKLAEEEEDEKENQQEFNEKMMISSKIFGKQLDYTDFSSTQQLHEQKLMICIQYHQLRTQITNMVEQTKYSLLQMETLQFLIKELTKTFRQMITENSDIQEEVTEIIGKLEVKNNQLQQMSSYQIQERLYFYNQEYIKNSNEFECTYLSFIFPFADGQAIKEEIQLNICKFLNNKGGFLFLGIMAENRLVTGIHLDKEKKLNFKEFLIECTSEIIPIFETNEIFGFTGVRDLKMDLEIPNLYVIRIVVNQGKDLNKVYFFKDSNQNSRSSFKNIKNASQKEIEQEEQLLKQFPREQSKPLEYNNILNNEFATQSTLKNLRAKARQKQIEQSEQLTQIEKKELLSSNVPNLQKSPSPRNTPQKLQQALLTPKKQSQSEFTIQSYSQVNEYYLDIYFYENQTDQHLDLILMQLLDELYEEKMSYKIKRIEQNQVQLIINKRRFNSTLGMKIIQNQSFLKKMNCIHKIIQDTLPIYEFDLPNDNFQQIEHSQIIMLIGFNKIKSKQFFFEIQSMIKREKINIISIDNKYCSIVVLIKEINEAQKFIYLSKTNIQLNRFYDLHHQFQIGYFSNHMKIQFYDQNIVETLKQWPGISINYLTNYIIQLKINFYVTAIEIYEYLRQYEQSLNKYRITPLKIDYQLINK